ncbi:MULTISPECIES: DHH family phosphoesterase [Gammaproteobacteria]|uniref:DHHA1 domain-containing protein n=1 Tax=Gammaproteobacteria TaxID=1236 RepID=UPI000DCF8A95|nr:MULTISPECIES: DHH family phosphoesterase [Gammaproteobacteria]RTE86048.1 DHH family phosphoesterase [Aliidiomarina sp. B3213]TCZ91402.1 DHH family phosphoesterase [Lysobacter sp. N42]
MNYIDVFNGDADGICSLLQLRKVNPVPRDQQTLITGVKRDNALIKQISPELAKGSTVHALDISFDKNTGALKAILDDVDTLFYCDHHRANTLFEHERMMSIIDPAPTQCTGLLMSHHLGGMEHLWAITAAFGDSLDAVAYREADEFGLNRENTEQLKELGVLLNYNGYGATLEDLHYAPADLYELLYAYDSPFDVINDSDSPFAKLKAGFAADMVLADSATTLSSSPELIAVQLEQEAWSRRISGTLGNQLAHEKPNRAVVILTPNADGKTYTVSLRAPKNNLQGAGEICARYPSGGGRAGAAGINALESDLVESFLHSVVEYYS